MDFSQVTPDERLGLAVHGFQSRLDGKDGFLETLQIADSMTQSRKAEASKRQTAGFLQSVLTGTDPAEALRRFPETDPDQVKGFLAHLMSRTENDRQFSRDQAAQIAGEQRRTAADIAKEGRATAAEQGAADLRALAGQTMKADTTPPANVAPTGTSIIPRYQGFLDTIEGDRQAANKELQTRTQNLPGFNLAAEQERERQLGEEQKRATIEKAKAGVSDPTAVLGFLGALAANGNQITPELLQSAGPGAAKTAEGLVKQRIGAENAREMQADRLAAAKERYKAVVGGAAGAATLPPEIASKLAQYAAHGFVLPTPPSFGFGAAGMPARIQFWTNFINEAEGIGGGGEYAANRAQQRADTSSLNKQQTSRDLMNSFVNNIGKQVDRVSEIAQDVSRTDVRLLNIPLRALALRVKGSADEVKVNMYLTEIANEIGKLSTSGLAGSVQELSQSAQQTWSKIHDPNLSIQDLLSVLAETKHAGQMRLDTVDQALGTTKNRIRGVPATTQGTSKPAAAPTVTDQDLNDARDFLRAK